MVLVSRKNLKSIILQEMFSPGFGCQKREISINDIPITVEVADTDFLRNKGLMFRESMPDNDGMLFVFPDNVVRSFWMKNTLIPLSIAFIDHDGYITNIEDMTPHDLNNTISTSPATRALEMNKGWFDDMGISPGDYVVI